MATTKKTVKMIAKKVESKKMPVDKARRYKAKEAEEAATAKEEELSVRLVHKSEFRKLVQRVAAVETLLEALHRDVCDTELEVQELQQATVWKIVKKFFSRKVW